MNYFSLKAFLLTIIHCQSILCEIDLFNHINTNCQDSILKRKEHRDATWKKIIKVKENQLRQCRKLCGKKEIVQTHCRQHEPDFVEDLGFKIQSDKCCDTKSCKCVCSYKCSTLKTKMQDLQAIQLFRYFT